MSKRPSLATIPNFSAIQKAAGSVHAQGPATNAEAVESPIAIRPKAASKTREGTAQVGAHYPIAVRQQLKLLAAEKVRTMEDMLAEALNDLFAKYGKAEIAPRTSKTEGA